MNKCRENAAGCGGILPFWIVDNLHALLCGIFHSNSAVVARYGAFIQAKSPTNCDVHPAKAFFKNSNR
ncbi:DUF6783 domain-containing protein [Ruminococcus sp. 1001136sp1]|uniref:DUF6783 domain-containing protein n=1 Tax=Ruminococcus sp. D40t1_170626_H2 TaxID=2787081 RepID=UPI002EA7CC24|nr:DUF6783 domain-containing protein [Blautia faecis]